MLCTGQKFSFLNPFLGNSIKKLEKGKNIFGNSKRFQRFKRRNKILYKNIKKNNKKDYQKDYENHSSFKKKKKANSYYLEIN